MISGGIEVNQFALNWKQNLEAVPNIFKLLFDKVRNSCNEDKDCKYCIKCTLSGLRQVLAIISPEKFFSFSRYLNLS